MKVSEVIGKRMIDLNVDIGEGFPYDDDLLRFASSANICVGAHAGSWELTRETVDRCMRHRVRIGVHPGYPDRTTMGRRTPSTDEEAEYFRAVIKQTARFGAVAKPAYVKPHGAFYNDTAMPLSDDVDAVPEPGRPRPLLQTGAVRTLLLTLKVHRIPLLGLPRTTHEVIAARCRQTLIREGFADRRFRSDGTLMDRAIPGAVLREPEEVRDQVQRLAPVVDSICLHGDTPDCLAFAEMVYRTLTDMGYGIGA